MKEQTPEGFKLARIKLRLTQEELADRLEIHRTGVNYFENGKRPISKVVALAIRCVVIEEMDNDDTIIDI